MFSIAVLSSEAKSQRIVEEIVLGKRRLCPTCQEELLKTKEYYWCKACRKKVRLKALTWFRKSRLSYRKLLVLIWCWQKRINPGAVKHLSGISYTTTSRWYSRFRTNLPYDEERLNGVVEVDEAFFGRQKYANQKILMGAIERKSGKVKLAEIPDRDQDSLEYFLWNKVHPESKLHTDCHTGYYDLQWYGYGHELHNHSLGHFRGTNRIENVWSVAKRQIRRMYGQIKTTKLQEFALEWEARRNFPQLFHNPVTYLQATCSVLVD